MDLLFKRYASPLSFIDNLIEMGMLQEGIEKIYEKHNEELMFEMYLHSNPFVAPNLSFNEWKENVKGQTTQRKGMTEDEVKTAYELSQDILKKFVS